MFHHVPSCWRLSYESYEVSAFRGRSISLEGYQSDQCFSRSPLALPGPRGSGYTFPKSNVPRGGTWWNYIDWNTCYIYIVFIYIYVQYIYNTIYTYIDSTTSNSHAYIDKDMCLQRSRRTPSHFDLYQWHPQSNVVKPKKHPSYQLDVILPQILGFFSSQSQHWGCQLALALSRALALTLHLEIFFLGYWVDPILLGRCWRFWNWMIHDDSMYTYVHTQSYICIYIAHKRNPFLWFRIYIYTTHLCWARF